MVVFHKLHQVAENVIIIIIIIFVYYSCSHNATTEPTMVTQDSTDTIEHKTSIYNETPAPPTWTTLATLLLLIENMRNRKTHVVFD